MHEEKIISSIKIVSFFQQEKLNIHMQENEIEHLSYIIHKIQLKIDSRLNLRPEAIILLEENLWSKLFAISFGNYILDLTPKAKISKRDHKLKGFCSTK